MNHRYIFLLQVIQNIWWIAEMLFIKKSSNYTYYFLCSLCITTRLLASIVYLKKHQKHDRFNLITTLANNVCYTEANINFESKNLYLNHINTLIILLNYIESQTLIKNQTLDLLSRFAFPTYVLIRLISLIFIQFDIQLCEAASLMALFLLVYFSNQNVSINSTQSNPKLDQSLQNCSASLHQSQVKQEKRLTQNSNKMILYPEKGSQPRNSIQINIKDSYREESAPIPTFHSKLKPGFKSQYSHLIVDRNDSQLQNFYQNLVNVLPEGVLMLNKFQQIQFISSKCEKLLECDGKERVLEYIKKCLANCDLPDEVQSLTKTKGKLTQRVLEEIIRIYKQNSQDLDIFDVLLNPNKYIQPLFLGQNGSFEQERSSSGSIYFSDPSLLQEHTFCFEGSIDKEKCDQSKKLKFILVQTQMTLSQQEAISQSGLTNSKKQNSNDIPQPMLLILIKNTTHKNRVRELKKERLINNSLLKSFSHELRTPLNSCQYMLNLIKEVSKDELIQQYLNTAQSSIKLLIYQINDILDFAAMQSKTFSYHTTTFSIKDLIQEIKELYDQQVSYKNIKLEIEYDQILLNQFFINDKQRIMQVLVNLLNNSCKFTKPTGEIYLSFRQMKGNLIEVSVRDDGIGIQSNKLEQIRKTFCKPSSKISYDSGLGFGLKISGKIVKGLTYNKTYLDINSSINNGTQVSFVFQNQEIMNQECLLSPQQSNITGRFEILSPASSSQLIPRSELSQSLMKGLQQKFENPQNESTFVKEHLESPRINEDQSNSVIIPTSSYHFKTNLTQTQKKQGSLLSFQINSNNCENCSQILIVDDIPFNQIAFIQMLNHFKIKAESAFDGYQAIEMVKQKLTKHCKFYRLIFMDIEMPGQNGFQTSKIISQIHGVQSIIVMCSAYDTLENYNFAQQVGITEFLPKPVNKKDLDKILKKYLFKI
ncbi:unnamed protein product [Paramecium pentaurelia]|uniref:Uncharacterized protein n=1 Tax=Paramecium pentaurelia TaxID=43138 RepID=A0A8S1XKV7_9CILI|nr:unnamed protein product [Paramecium pentaurelia]